MFKIKSANTIIYCARWDASRHFYGTVLGFSPRFCKDDWFIEFALRDGACLSIADAARCTIEPAHGEGLTLSFHVEELATLHAHLSEAGLEPTPVKAQGWRAPYFYVYDPEGNRIEFWADSV